MRKPKKKPSAYDLSPTARSFRLGRERSATAQPLSLTSARLRNALQCADAFALTTKILSFRASCIHEGRSNAHQHFATSACLLYTRKGRQCGPRLKDS